MSLARFLAIGVLGGSRLYMRYCMHSGCENKGGSACVAQSVSAHRMKWYSGAASAAQCTHESSPERARAISPPLQIVYSIHTARAGERRANCLSPVDDAAASHLRCRHIVLSLVAPELKAVRQMDQFNHNQLRSDHVCSSACSRHNERRHGALTVRGNLQYHRSWRHPSLCCVTRARER